jgi:RNA polymerase sigma factor (TIGR02999 family)
VHEAYLRLIDLPREQAWDGRGHFFSAAAEAMRRILIESARRRKSLKQGGDLHRVPLEDLVSTDVTACDTLLDVDGALSRFAEVDPQTAELVKLRLYAGLSIEEAAETLGMSRSSAYENWTWAKAWFACQLAD